MKRILACMACSAVVSAQDRPFDDVRKRLDEEGWLVEVEWKVDETGRVFQKPDPSIGADVEIFGPIVGVDGPFSVVDFASYAVDFGWWGRLQFLLLGDRDLVSATRAAYHFEQLGYGVDWVDLRERMTQPASRDTLGRHPDLERYLAVRLAARHGVRALPDLVALARDEDADLLLRLAARDVASDVASVAARLLDLEVERPPAVTLETVLKAIPTAYDLVLTVDQRALPAMGVVSGESRRARALGVLAQLEAAGPANVSWLTWAGAQLLSDRPGVLPYELARLIGNCRIDRTTLAVAFDDDGVPQYWARVDGLFQGDRLRAQLVESGAEVESVESGFEAELEIRPAAWEARTVDWELVFGDGHLEVRTSSYPEGDRKKSELVGAGWDDGDAVWVHLPANASLGNWGDSEIWGFVVRGLASATVKIQTAEGLSARAKLEFAGAQGEAALRRFSQVLSLPVNFSRHLAPWSLLWSTTKTEWGDNRAEVVWTPGATTLRQWCEALSTAGVR